MATETAPRTLIAPMSSTTPNRTTRCSICSNSAQPRSRSRCQNRNSIGTNIRRTAGSLSRQACTKRSVRPAASAVRMAM